MIDREALKSELIKELNRVAEHEKRGWDDVRDESNFELCEIVYPFGARKVYRAKAGISDYEGLQHSRGTTATTDFDEFQKQMRIEALGLTIMDMIRISEIEIINSRHNFIDKATNFIEIGFRVPKLMGFYSQQFKSTLGYDVSKLSVLSALYSGFNAKLGDIRFESGIDASDARLIVCYHVLEHVTNPLESLSFVAKTMDKDAILHIEVPIEPDGPHLRFSHLYPFHQDDLPKMLELVGLQVGGSTNDTHTYGPVIQRCIAKKIK